MTLGRIAALAMCANITFAHHPSPVQAQPLPIQFGVLLDLTSFHADVGGRGSETSARMAAEDFGGTVLDRPSKIIMADHGDKADVASNLARQWFDIDGITAIMDVTGSATAPSVMLDGPDAQHVAGRRLLDHAAETTDGPAVMQAMRDAPIDDAFTTGGHIRADGSMVHDMYVFEVKKPSESHDAWDYYKLRTTIPAEQAFAPLSASKCPLVIE